MHGMDLLQGCSLSGSKKQNNNIFVQLHLISTGGKHVFLTSDTCKRTRKLNKSKNSKHEKQFETLACRSLK